MAVSQWARPAAIMALAVSLTVVVMAHAVAADQGLVGDAFKAAHDFWDLVGPGGKLHPAYFLEHKGHLVIEGLLVALIVYLTFQQAFQVKPSQEAPLTDKEVEQLCKEWRPEPLTRPLTDAEKPPEPPVITGYDGLYCTVQGKQGKVLNLAWSNYLAQSTDPDSKETSIACVNKYGVGACGPRGFYGTIDVHLDIEAELASFFGTENGIIYSYDVATISSIIPAFANRKDIIVVDEYCSYPVQAGCVVSRAKVLKFKHNDVADLERVIQQAEAEERKKSKPLCRKLVIVEAVYTNYGDIAPLDKIVAIKDKYKYRLLVDESHSFGVLGATGRGAGEHFGLKPGQIEIIAASMSHAMGSVGGFCVGDRTITEHQRLSGSGYCFSASLPPYLAAAGINMIQALRRDGAELLPKLKNKITSFRSELAKGVPGLKVYGGVIPSPVVHLHLESPTGNALADTATLRKMTEHMLNNANILATVSVYSNLDTHKPPPSIIMYVNVGLSDAELSNAANALRAAAKAVLGK